MRLTFKRVLVGLALAVLVAFSAAIIYVDMSKSRIPMPSPTPSASATEQVELLEGQLVFSELPQEGCGNPADQYSNFTLKSCILPDGENIEYYSVLSGELAGDMELHVFIWLETSQGEKLYLRYCKIPSTLLKTHQTVACKDTAEQRTIKANVVYTTATALIHPLYTPARVPEGYPSIEGTMSKGLPIAMGA